MYIFDTDSLSNIVKKNPSLRLLEKLKEIPSEFQYTTSINVAEIFYGAECSEHKEKILKAFQDIVFKELTILPFDEHSAMIYGELKAKLEKRGIVKSEPDLRIAAIAIQNRFILITGMLEPIDFDTFGDVCCFLIL